MVFFLKIIPKVVTVFINLLIKYKKTSYVIKWVNVNTILDPYSQRRVNFSSFLGYSTDDTCPPVNPFDGTLKIHSMIKTKHESPGDVEQ